MFPCNRLQFGIHSAIGIFQCTIENVLRDIPHYSVYLYDVIVTGPTDQEHLTILECVLKRMSKGVAFKSLKMCVYFTFHKLLGIQIVFKGYSFI